MAYKVVFIEKMDTALWQRVRIATIKRDITISVWMIEAIRVKLRKENG